jgi:hypothetical protein
MSSSIGDMFQGLLQACSLPSCIPSPFLLQASLTSPPLPPTPHPPPPTPHAVVQRVEGLECAVITDKDGFVVVKCTKEVAIPSPTLAPLKTCTSNPRVFSPHPMPWTAGCRARRHGHGSQLVAGQRPGLQGACQCPASPRALLRRVVTITRQVVAFGKNMSLTCVYDRWSRLSRLLFAPCTPPHTPAAAQCSTLTSAPSSSFSSASAASTSASCTRFCPRSASSWRAYAASSAARDALAAPSLLQAIACCAPRSALLRFLHSLVLQ